MYTIIKQVQDHDDCIDCKDAQEDKEDEPSPKIPDSRDDGTNEGGHPHCTKAEQGKRKEEYQKPIKCVHCGAGKPDCVAKDQFEELLSSYDDVSVHIYNCVYAYC